MVGSAESPPKNMNLYPDKTILTVSRLTTLLRDVLEENFQQIWVEGEISNFSTPSSGHLYFTLKDAGAQLRCVMFKSAGKNLKFRPKDGMGVIARGRISLYDQRGEYQLIVEYLEPAGIGALQTAYLQLKERLGAEGLFNPEHKRPIPNFPRTIGVITSPTGAAIHDILNVLKRRFAALQILIYPVRVQGEGSWVEIANAIDEMNRNKLADVLIVGRGGGSLEDLWGFNEEIVARSIYRSQIPVISAVGHETDWTIADFVADLRAPTPSAAAEMVIKSASELRTNLEQFWHRLVLSMDYVLKNLNNKHATLKRSLTDPSKMLGHLSQRLDDCSERLKMAIERDMERNRDKTLRLQTSLHHNSPESLISIYKQTIEMLSKTLRVAMLQSLENSRNSFELEAAALEILSPLKTLGRGYAIASTLNGNILTDAATLKTGEIIKLRLHKGSANCRVESIE